MKKLVALLLAVAMLLSFAACGESDPVTDPTDAIEETTDAVDAGNEATDPVANPVEGETTAAADGTTVAEDGSTQPGETTTAAAPLTAPTTPAEVLNLYNKTINDAYAAKVGFSKERYTDGENLNAGFLLKQFEDLIYKFMGVGAANKYSETVTKGKWDADLKHHYLRKSTLTAADITNATCAVNGNQYTITLNVKNGTSKASKDVKQTNAPIDKCGICVGDEDKGYYDHKTGPVIYDAIDDFLGGAKIDESYSNATVKAVIDSTTGQLISLTVEFNINVIIDAVGGGDATAKTHIKYTNFKY